MLDYKINPKAFINAHNFKSIEDLIEEIKRIDNDDEAYLSMLREPVFLDNVNPYREYEDKLIAFFDNIFSQTPQEASRRGSGQHLYWNEHYLKAANKACGLYHKYKLNKLRKVIRGFKKLILAFK